MKSILLVEPDYHNKFPPLGLMKLAAFFRERGDYVRFVKGRSATLRAFGWDAILITTLFTFEWKRTVETVKYYARSPGAPRIVVGGILATLLPERLQAETGATVILGLLDAEGKLGVDGDGAIESAVPDYSILDEVDYDYPTRDAYFIHATRGCVNRCQFCAVPAIEPEYRGYISVTKQVDGIRRAHGEKRDLILMDNNTLASPHFNDIIDEVLECGFAKGARLGRRLRWVDFNQGLDVRLLDLPKIQRLAETAIHPLRIAFDDIKLREQYEQGIRWAAAAGLKRLSNYILFNCNDTPEDFYTRLRVNVELNAELGTHIYSFPMRYSPVRRVDRTYIGAHWTWRYVRGVQCILNATRGVVGIGRDFFLRAFGSSPDDFVRLISMPESYIMQRTEYELGEAELWKSAYAALSDAELADFRSRALHSREPKLGSSYARVETLLAHY